MIKLFSLSLIMVAAIGSVVPGARASDTVVIGKNVLFANIDKKRVGLYAASGDLSAFQVKRTAERNAQDICKALNYGNVIHFEYQKSQRALLGDVTSVAYRFMQKDGKAEVQQMPVNPSGALTRLVDVSPVIEHFEFVSIECENIRSASLEIEASSEMPEASAPSESTDVNREL